MMPRRLTILLLFATLTLGTTAQSAPDDYAARLSHLAQMHAKNPSGVEPLYLLAQFYFDNSHPMRNLPQASRYAEQAEIQHTWLLQHDKLSELHRLGRQGIDLANLRLLRRAIDEAALQSARTRNDMTLTEVEEYLDRFGHHAETARLLRNRKLQLILDQTLSHGSATDCYTYMQTYAGTEGATQAETQLVRILSRPIAEATSPQEIDRITKDYPASSLLRQKAESRKAQLAYSEAEQEGTLLAYNRFLALYPTSNESAAARAQVEHLMEIDLMHRHTAQQLVQFADSNADSPLADRALARLRKLIYRTHDIAAARLYVTHFPLDPYRNEVYSRYYSWYAEEGNGAPLRQFAEQNPDFPFPNALESDLERGDYVDTIALWRPFSDNLYTIYADHVRNLSGKAIAIVPLQRMLQGPLAKRNYAAAIETVQQFELCFNNQHRQQYDRLLHLLATANPNLRPQTEMADTLPVEHPCINPTDGMLYFSRQGYVCRASKTAKGWRLKDTLDIAGAEGERLTLFGLFNDGNLMTLGHNGDIWIAEHDTEGWRISDIPPYPVNTDYVETDAHLTPDGSGLLLASDRPGGLNLQASGTSMHGDTALASDLYYIPYTRSGWGNPIHLGMPVNSIYCERSPVLSRNLHTLYFISDRPDGLGYGDIYVAEREDGGDWTSWSAPRNIGREANSPWPEEGLSLSRDEKRLYYGSRQGGRPTAAHSLQTSHNTAPASQSYTIELGETANHIVRMHVADMQSGQEVQVIAPDQSETLDLQLDGGRQYALLADAGNRFVCATVIGPRQQGGYRLPAYTYAELVAMDRELPLPVVQFARGKAEPTAVARTQMEQLARFVRLNRQCTVELSVDATATDATEAYTLSIARAEALRELLVEHGIAPSRISLSPYGNVRLRNGGNDMVSLRLRD